MSKICDIHSFINSTSVSRARHGNKMMNKKRYFFTALRELNIYWGKLLLHLLELLNKIKHILGLAHDVSLRFSLTPGFLQYEIKAFACWVTLCMLQVCVEFFSTEKTISVDEYYKVRNKLVNSGISCFNPSKTLCLEICGGLRYTGDFITYQMLLSLLWFLVLLKGKPKEYGGI